MIKEVIAYLVNPALADSKFVKLGLIFSAGLLVLSLIVFVIRRFTLRNGTVKGVWAKLGTLVPVVQVASLLWLILFFLRYEAISPFDMRIWVYIVLIGFIVACVYYWRKQRKIAPIEMKQQNLDKVYHSYLPKPKSKRSLS